MREKALPIEDALSLAAKIDPKYRPVWNGRPAEEQAALANYILPHGSRKPSLTPTRPRIIKWYCPFASQSEFPSGHRYCINVYTGCAHQCMYCYAAAYEPVQPACKNRFEALIQRDVEDLERFGVPPAPIHLSNSTDPFQCAGGRSTACRLLASQDSPATNPQALRKHARFEKRLRMPGFAPAPSLPRRKLAPAAGDSQGYCHPAIPRYLHSSGHADKALHAESD
jgi:hypothetical protein